jgi:uncharacterized protein YukE
VIPAGGSAAGAGSAGGFPALPTGSPGEISAIARSLGQAASELEQTEHGLTSATEALMADWSGYAANAYRGSSGALAGAARGASASLRECAGAVSGYAAALEAAQTELTRLQGLYEEAKAREAAAAANASALDWHLATATKSAARHQLQGDISNADHQASSAGDEAAAYMQRAVQVLDEFHHQESRYMQTLAGGGEVVGGRSLPAGSPFAAPFSGVGATGAGFGVPYTAFGGIVPGGLASFDGVIPVGNPWSSDIPGFGVYLDGQTENLQPTNDLTAAITFLAAPVAGKAAEELLATGGRAFMEEVGIGSAGRESAAQAGHDASLTELYSGDYSMGDAAKVQRILRDRQLGSATRMAGQEETQNQIVLQTLDGADKAGWIPSGVKETAEWVLAHRPYFSARIGQAAGALSRFFTR